MFLFLLVKYLGNELLGHIVDECSFIWRNCHTSFQSNCTILYLYKQCVQVTSQFHYHGVVLVFFFLKWFYLFMFRKRGRKGERGRETPTGCLSHPQVYQGPGLQPRHVPEQEWTGDLWLCTMTLNQLSHIGQGSLFPLQLFCQCPIGFNLHSSDG